MLSESPSLGQHEAEQDASIYADLSEQLADDHSHWTAETQQLAAASRGSHDNAGREASRHDSRSERSESSSNSGKDERTGSEPALASVARLFVGPNKQAASIEQGSAIIRVLAFAGSLVSTVLCILSVFNPMVFFGSPIVWAIAAYQGIFSLTTLIFEAKPEWVQTVSFALDLYQDYVMNNAAFLSRCLGRGLFYIFQGSLWGSVGYSLPTPDNAPIAQLFHFVFQMSTRILGIYFILLGIAHVLMHFDVFPQHYAHKIKRGSIMVTERVATALVQLQERRNADANANARAPSISQQAASAARPLHEGHGEVELSSR